jgi:molybdopterin synthase sulfur carrier subunit
MSIRILFFASIADAAGKREMELPAEGQVTVRALFDSIARDLPQLAARRGSLLCAVNAEFSRLDAPVRNGDEVAFFPPMSGG